ncbi:hypothetical protein RN51_03164 [Microbacterium oxydans]|uniref:Uncharacterized protein n=1 Tax=Microbacterium oxydans TaxID=82380 RepID=A0A0F0KBP3_9MICO|nr:DUF6325 family protein [Microbacterium oxydans]KJL18332.1 hypothetical protein RN51_03164 [Microbacterium oxydans]
MAEVVDVTSLRALGDVEFVVVRLEEDRLSSHVLEALLRQVESGAIRLLDFVMIRRLDHDAHRLVEVDRDDFTLAGLALGMPGLIGADDVGHFAARIPIGALSAVVLVELAWVERFARDLDWRTDRILTTQQIPAAVANAVLFSALRHT